MMWFVLFPLTCAIAGGVFTPKVRRHLPDSYPSKRERQRLRNVGFTAVLMVVSYAIALAVLFVAVVAGAILSASDADSPLVPALFVVLSAIAVTPLPSLHVRRKYRNAIADFAYEAKDRRIATVLALFLGGLGAHKLYVGRRRKAVLYLLFCWTIVPWLYGLRAAYRFATMDPSEFAQAVAEAHGEPIPDAAVDLSPDRTDDSAPRDASRPSTRATTEAGSDYFDEPRDRTPASPDNSSSPKPSSPAESSSDDGTVDELERLYALYEDGAITEAEYEQSKTDLIESS